MSNWANSILKTSDLLLAVVVGALFERLVQEPLVFFEGEAVFAVLFICLLKVLAKYWKPVVPKMRRLTSHTARWVIDILAGSLFGTGYAALVLYWPAGVLLIGLEFVMVALALDIAKTIQLSFLGGVNAQGGAISAEESQKSTHVRA